LGLDPQPIEALPPETGTWGEHPPLPDMIEQAINERQLGGSVEAALTVLSKTWPIPWRDRRRGYSDPCWRAKMPLNR
jgi:hypothetical protein